ncbi:MAG: pirin family protein [Sandaracinaceae bacterium]|nr:pirin family protein [Sandaracinaceae bacterium]
MIQIRRSEERGHAFHGWLDSHHTFSFAGYHDPKHMGFRALRVINEDRVREGAGFPRHGHRDMEIVSVVLAGAIEHEDSMGHKQVLRPGEVQRMTAGTGVTHSEYNPSPDEPLHFLQIWILPEQQGLKPGYEQRAFPEVDRQDKLRLLVSRDGRDGALTIHQDAELYGTLLSPGRRVEHALASGRHAWVQLARGRVKVNGVELAAGDGAALSDEPRVTIEGLEPSEALLFDLA